MLVAWLLPAALAAPPDERVQLLDVDVTAGNQVERMKVSPAGDVLVGRTRGTFSGWLYDLNGWTLETFAPCEVTGVAPIDLTDAGIDTTEIWTACGDGRVVAKVWDGVALADLTADGSTPLSVEVADSLSDIWYDPNSDLLYALSLAGNSNAMVHVIDPFSAGLSGVDSAVSPNFPKPLAFSGYVEGTLVVANSATNLVVSHGGRGMSSLVLGDNNATVVSDLATAVECDDIAPSNRGSILCVDRQTDRVAEFIVPFPSPGTVLGLGKLDGPEAVGASESFEDDWIAVTGNQVVVWEVDNGSLVTPPAFTGPPNQDNPINDIVGFDGYLFGGGPEGRLHVVTARPWVYPNSVEITAGGVPIGDERRLEGDELELTFQIDEDADWEVRIGSDRFGVGGVRVAEGSTPGNTDVVLPLTVNPDDFDEGTNFLYILATNDEGLTGHARGEVNVDNPPDPPDVGNGDLRFGDRALTLDVAGIRDEDLDHYDVYVMATEWDGADWPEGGPDYDGDTELENPIKVEASGGDRLSVTIRPLENDVTYYIGVRATDAGGKEGPMSAIVSGTPREAFTAASRANDPGGAPCSTGGGAAAGAASVLILLGLLRRRTGIAGAALAAALPLLCWPSTGLAQDDSTPPWLRNDLTPARGDFEIRYGVINLVDENITDIYDQSATNLLQIEMGPQFFRVVELDFGFGFFQELAFTVDADGNPSSDRTMLTWWPIAVDVTGRLHLLDEQPVVPFVRYGFDYIIWSERSDDGFGGKDIVRGAKWGTHTALGAQLLLDIFQPRRASLLEAQSGINDSWLTFEWRRQRVDGRTSPWAADETTTGLNFSGDAIMIGLKLDY